MKKLNKRLGLAVALALLFLLVACGNDGMPVDTSVDTSVDTFADTSADTAAVTTLDETDQTVTAADTETVAQPTETDADADTGAETVADTQAATEAATSAVTETGETEALEEDTHVPVPLTEVDFNDAAARLEKKGKTASDFVGRVNKAKASFVERDGAKVLALTTDGITVNTADPFVQMKYSVLAELMGDLNVNVAETPYMVLRVKNESLWSHTFALRSYKSTNPSVNDGGLTGLQKVHLADTSDWQYISFDLSLAAENAITYRLVFENAANASGETLLISSIQFFATKEEAEALAGTNTYEIKEQTADNYGVKVMSFNVQTENGTSVRTDIRADMLRDLLDKYQPDSIGLQEVTPTWRSQMDSYVFNGSYTGVGDARTTDASLGLEQSCIFYRSDKFDLLDSGTFWLSDTPTVVGSTYEGSQYPRICTYVHLKDKVTGLEYIHMNTHLAHEGGQAGRDVRVKQVSVLLNKLHELDAKVPVVITGDFNQRKTNTSGNDYNVYRLMTGTKAFTLADGSEYTFENLADARIHATESALPEGTISSQVKYRDPDSENYLPSKEPIDYCFYSADKLEAVSYDCPLYGKDGTYLSDHLPVIATFKFMPATNE